VIDWLTPWPEEALHSVATVFLAELDIPDEFRPVILAHIVMVYMSVCKLSVDFVEQTRRTNYVTPKTFLDYIESYRTSLTKRRGFNETQCKRLDGGLAKIAQAKVEVDQMQVRINRKAFPFNVQSLLRVTERGLSSLFMINHMFRAPSIKLRSKKSSNVLILLASSR
jgi:hypothetical protein